MIKKAAEFTTDYRENMRGGNGTVEITSFATPEELNNKGRLFANITLKPGCGIGYHVHDTDCELFYMLKGEALYNDNGTEYPVSAGDVMVCPTGTGHSITNNGTEVVELCAVILYA